MNETEPKVVMYSSRLCPFCLRARFLLKRKGVDYKEIFVDGNWELHEEMMQKSGRRSVPQIFIEDHYVGGFDDMNALDRAGKLDPLLGLEARMTPDS